MLCSHGRLSIYGLVLLKLHETATLCSINASHYAFNNHIITALTRVLNSKNEVLQLIP